MLAYEKAVERAKKHINIMVSNNYNRNDVVGYIRSLDFSRLIDAETFNELMEHYYSKIKQRSIK